MPNIATVLKDEISRIARKEMRAEIAPLKKAVNAVRVDVAALKRRSHVMEQELRRLRKAGPKVASVDPNEPSSRAQRFSAKGLASQRQRLKLSADDCGALVGVSGQSIYNWESGTARPRAEHLAAIATLRAMGKKEAALKIASHKKAFQRG